MTLDDIEARAQQAIFIADNYGLQFPSEQLADELARALVRYLPVIRAAEAVAAAKQAWDEKDSGENEGKLTRSEVALVNAITTAGGGRL